MITDAILDALFAVVMFFLSLLPEWSLPGWWLDAMVGWGQIVSGIADLAHWVPLDAVANVAIAVVLVSVFSFSVQILRIVSSYLTGGGGKI